MLWQRALWVFVAIVISSVSGHALADPLTPFQPGSSEVTIQDVLPHFDAPESRGNEFYSEWWSFVFTMDDGYWAYVQFLVSNLGSGDGNVTVRAQLRLPDDQEFSEKTELNAEQWSWARDRFEITFGDNSLAGPLDALVIKVKNASFEAEYRLKNLVPPWKPGTGRAQYGASPSRYFQFTVMAPIAQMEGTVRVAGEDKARTVKGIVHADHSLTTIGMQEQAKRNMRFRSINPKSTLLITDIEPPSIYGTERIQYAVLWADGKKVFETTRLDIKYGNDYVDPKKAGYACPRLIEIGAKDGDQTARIVLKMDKLTGREDFLETANAATRFVVSKFAKPMMYDFDGRFAAEIKSGGKATRYGEKGRYYYTIVNL
ncbi:MAG TPA: hypothetical protein PK373_10925 [Sedimentisphaerales bacterium]|nr:hypothetical protein [Sedimentisphaerales bacterium]